MKRRIGGTALAVLLLMTVTASTVGAMHAARAAFSGSRALGAGVTTQVATPSAPSPATPSSPANYTFLGLAPDGRPIGWNACEPIGYQINLNGAPASSQRDITTAISMLSRASGFRFIFEGTTGQLPGSQREKAALAGDVAPLLIAFTSVPPPEYGEGGAAWEGPAAGPIHNFYGFAEIDPAVEHSPGFQPGAFEGPLLLHELGHAMGLDHPTQSGQIMWPEISADSPRQYQSGDIAGLAALHAQAC